MTTAALTAIMIGLSLVIVLALAFRRVGDREIERFEHEHELTTSRTVRRFLHHYLATARRLRAVAFLAVVLVVPLGTGAVYGQAHVIQVASTPVVVALMVATLLAELTLARPAAEGSRRVASLRPRVLRAYLTRTLRFGPTVVGVAATVTWFTTLVVDDSTLSTINPRPTADEVGAGVGVALVGPVLVTLACRWIVRRPQPLIDPSLAAADDAVRTASVRHLAAMGCIVALFNLTGALSSYADASHGRRDTVLWVVMGVTTGVALLAWLARGWGPVVPPARPDGSLAAGPPTGPRAGGVGA